MLCGNEEKWVLHPIYSGPKTRPVLKEPNRPKAKSSKAQRAPSIFLSFFTFCTPPDYCCTPLCCNFIPFFAFSSFFRLHRIPFIILVHVHPFGFIILPFLFIVYLFLYFSHLENVFRFYCN